MPDKPRSGASSLFYRIFRIRLWGDAERTKSFYEYVREMFNRLFVLSPKPVSESFDQAVKRLNLSDEALLKKQQALFRLSILMGCLGVGMFYYSIYQWFYGTLQGVLLSLMVSSLAWVFAFRYHFWYFQIKQRKLGCSLYTWFTEGFLDLFKLFKLLRRGK